MTGNPSVEVSNFFAKSSPQNSEPFFINKWHRELLDITKQLDQKSILSSIISETNDAITTYINNKEHGAQHSYFVYEGMKWLAQNEGVDIDDSILQATAVLHDMSQFLPNKNPQTGEQLTNDQRATHPEIMARAVMQFGKALNIKEKDIHEIMVAIRHHDDTYTVGKYEHMRPLGNLLADADKLFGGGLSRDPNDLAIDAIKRNQQGSSNPQGWYLLRDLSVEERDGWRYGDRWLSDRVSPVRKDIYKTPFYTYTGKKIAEKRRTQFIKQAKVSYGEEYDDVTSIMELWGSHSKDTTIKLVGKNPDGTQPIEENITNINDIDAVVKRAYEKELPVKSRDGFIPRGWKIQITTDGRTYIIDPSIARFKTKEEFIDKLTSSFISPENQE